MSIDPATLPQVFAENDPTPLPHPSPDTLALLSRRRSAKPFFLAAPAPTAAQLEAILSLASRTPDHGKLTPWRFVVFEGAGAVRAGAALADVLAQSHEATEEALQARAPGRRCDLHGKIESKDPRMGTGADGRRGKLRRACRSARLRFWRGLADGLAGL